MLSQPGALSIPSVVEFSRQNLLPGVNLRVIRMPLKMLRERDFMITKICWLPDYLLGYEVGTRQFYDPTV